MVVDLAEENSGHQSLKPEGSRKGLVTKGLGIGTSGLGAPNLAKRRKRDQEMKSGHDLQTLAGCMILPEKTLSVVMDGIPICSGWT